MKNLILIISLVTFNCFGQFNEQAKWLQKNNPDAYECIVAISVTDSMINAQSEWYFVCISERYYSIDVVTYQKYAKNASDAFGRIDYYKLAFKLEQHLKLWD